MMKRRDNQQAGERCAVRYVRLVQAERRLLLVLPRLLAHFWAVTSE